MSLQEQIRLLLPPRFPMQFHIFPVPLFHSIFPFTPTRAMIVRHGILQEFLQSLKQHFYEEAYS